MWIVNRLIYRAFEKVDVRLNIYHEHNKVHISQYASSVFLTTSMLSVLPVVVLHHHTDSSARSYITTGSPWL